MRVLWFEFLLALRRLVRRRAQNGLLLVTFTVSVALSLLSWTLFHTVFLSQPDFDPQGDYYVMTYADSMAASGKHSTQAEIEAYKAGQEVFSDFAEIALYLSVFIQTEEGTYQALTAYLSSRALQIVGAQPLLGRLFTPEEDVRGSAAAALLSHRMWENNFGRDPDVVGKTVQVTGNPVTIVGVMPARFRFPNDQDLWLSYGSAWDSSLYPLRDALVKLKPGVTKQRAERDLQVILERMGPDTPANKNGLRPALIPLRDFFLVPDIRNSAAILLALSFIFVGVSCTNAANLMLIDFLGRRSEIATLLALGVPRGAAVRSICFQIGLIALGAAIFSFALLPVAGPFLYDRVQVINAPYWLTYQFDWRHAVVAVALAAVMALVTLIAPIVYLLWVDSDQVIREHAYASRGTGRAVWRRVLLTGQIALLTVLAVGAGLLMQSSQNVSQNKWGYQAGRVFTGRLTNLAMSFAREEPLRSEQRLATHRRVLEAVEQRPDTVAAALSDQQIGFSHDTGTNYGLDPADFAHPAGLGLAFGPRVTEGYFATLDVPLVAGRTLPRENPADGPIHAVINESLAQRLWPGQDPLQRALFVRHRWMKEADPPLQLTICGVVRDFQASGPVAKTNDVIFTPLTPMGRVGSGVSLYVRDRAGLPNLRELTAAVHRGEPRASFYFPITIKGVIDRAQSTMRMTKDLITVYALAALLLGAIGVYSLTVAQVMQSSREFGIRMALGAEPQRLWRHFTGGHLVTALIGVGIGLVGAAQAVRVLGALLYGVNPHSPATYVGVALAILVVAALACIPSLFRLKRINPADCLRSL
jgi:predicted permease